MKTQELKQKYLKFFASKGHKVISSASLIPENDPTVLFTTAGMHPLVPYLLGEKHSAGTRLTDFQKCIRTGDIDEVGDKWHLTFLEMLGNWSLNDYWKEDSLSWSFEFLTKVLEIPVNKLAVSIFEGDDNAPFDSESYKIWKNLGLPENKIYKYDKKENWWGPAGTTGPCGPDSEIFYITDKPVCGPDCQPSCSCGKYVEIWNNVFMEYFKDEKGNYNKAKNRNVDTGMGVARTVAVLNGFTDNYEIDTVKPVVQKIEEISGKKYLENKEITNSMRIVSDHIRASVMIMGDNMGVAPGNVDQGYVVRKLIRRAIHHGKKLGIENNFCVELSKVVIDIFAPAYPEIKKNEEFVILEMKKEEEKFRKVLNISPEKFKKKFIKLMNKFGKEGIEAHIKQPGQAVQIVNPLITGREAFALYSQEGIPKEEIIKLAKENKFILDIEDLNRIFAVEEKKHRDLSRAGAEQKFKGGLADTGEESKKLHTATHLLQAALRQVLGVHVKQKGSNITADRLRFDFSHSEKMTDEEKQKVEDLVNGWIKEDLEVKCEELPYDEAKNKGAIGLSEDKYGEVVKVYNVGEISKELCGGPHIGRTGELGIFKIKKEEASSAGIRRIKAVLK